MSSKAAKVAIPATLRNTIWNTYIGQNKKTGKCFCCNVEDISTANFECGHVAAAKSGGVPNIANLRPICSLCNKSMGARNMEEFMATFGYEKCAAWSGLVARPAAEAIEDETAKLKTKIKTKEKMLLDKIHFRELRCIASKVGITETLKSNIIDALLDKSFEYADWYCKYMSDTYNAAQLKTVYKYYKLKDRAAISKPDMIAALLRENKMVIEIEDVAAEAAPFKYFVECNGNRSITCQHCKRCSDDIIIQCQNCNNRHVYFTNDNIAAAAAAAIKIEYCKDYIRLWDIECATCKVTTISDIWNNPFHVFANKADRLKFRATETAKDGDGYDTLPTAVAVTSSAAAAMPAAATATTNEHIMSYLHEIKHDIAELKSMLGAIIKNGGNTAKPPKAAKGAPASVDDLLSM